MLTDYPDKLRPYVFHGVECTNDDVQSTGSCPFCDASRKLGIKVETGQYRCLACGETGNTYSFLQKLHERSFSRTSKADYAKLSAAWGVTPTSLARYGLCMSVLTDLWLTPGYNAKGALANLYKIATRKDEEGATREAPMGTPGCKPQMFLPHANTTSGSETVKPDATALELPNLWICEGVKDACALHDAFGSHKFSRGPAKKGETPPLRLIKTTTGALLTEHAIIAVPGCGNVSADWFPLFEGKDVRLCFDNDHPKRYGRDHEKAGELIKQKGKLVRPGWDGMERVQSLVSKSSTKPDVLRFLLWNPDGGHNEELHDGFDLRDLFHGADAIEAIQFLFDRTTPVDISPKEKAANGKPQSVIRPLECTSYKQLCDAYHSVLHFTPALEDTLAIILAVVLSTESEKVNHIWLRVIGPPGSGKSTLAEAVSVAREWISPKSIVTGFHSGFVDPNADAGKSASLIPELDCKTIIMKDGDTLINSPNRDRILSELRDLYDGTSRAHYRNMKVDEFEDIRMTFILCGTDELRSLNRTFLGERFIDCEIMKPDEDTKPFLQRAVTNTYAALAQHILPPKKEGGADQVSSDRMLYLKQMTYGFIKYLKDALRASTLRVPSLSQATDQRLQAMAQFVSHMRARKRDNHDDTTFKPRAELATRLTSQFTKLAFFLAVLLDKEAIDSEVMRLVLKVVLDTSLGLRLNIIQAMSKEEYLGVRQLHLLLDVPETTVRSTLEHMRTFEIAAPISAPNNSGQRGRDRHLWQMTSHFNAIYSMVFQEDDNAGNLTQVRRKRSAPAPKRRPDRD